MQEDDFLLFLQHFKNQARPSLEQKCLLLLDNHSSHISIKCLNFCKESGIVLLSFPPHCTHKLQPLDRAVFGAFKKMINVASDNWMRNNPGKTMTIHNIPSIVKEAYPTSITASNAIAGFQCTGISPFNRNIFTELDFAPSFVTDRPAPSCNEVNQPRQLSPVPGPSGLQGNETLSSDPERSEVQRSIPPTPEHGPGPSGLQSTNYCSQSGLPAFSPESIRPFPRAGPRQETTKGRKKRKSAILTDTPEKLALEEEYNSKKKVKRRVFIKKTRDKRKGKGKDKRTLKNQTESEDDDCFCLVCCETFNQSRAGEKWVQCLTSKNWSHEECTKGDTNYYICHNCISE